MFMARIALNEDFQLWCIVNSPKVHRSLLKALKAAGYKFHADYLGDKWQFVVNAKASTTTGIWDIFFKCGGIPSYLTTDQDA